MEVSPTTPNWLALLQDTETTLVFPALSQPLQQLLGGNAGKLGNK